MILVVEGGGGSNVGRFGHIGVLQRGNVCGWNMVLHGKGDLVI